MNHSPRNGFRLPCTDRKHHPGGSADRSTGNSVHYNRFQGTPFALSLALGALLTGCATQPEPAPEPEPVVQEAPAKPKPPVELAPRAPERYVVKKGDTLWDISTMFLDDPWLWPEIWYTNPQIENPHLIFPGDIITIFWKDGRPHLQISRGGEIYQTTLPIQRLSPQVRTTPLTQAIPTIPIDVIRPFLSNTRIIDEDEFEELPYVLRSSDGRLLSGSSNEVYARGLEDNGIVRYNVIRLGDEYIDPETGESLGFEATEVGTAVLQRPGDPATMLLEKTERETMRGDRLVPVDDREFDTNFLPAPPDVEVTGQIIDVVDGVSQVGQYQIVTLNRGAEDGLEIGHVLAVYQRGEVVEDNVGGGWMGEEVRLPDERAGVLMIFRTFENVSYGLIMHASSEIHLLDMVRNP